MRQQIMSRNSVTKSCQQPQSQQLLCRLIMSTRSLSTDICQQILCHRSTNYVNKICRLFGFQPLMSRNSVNRSSQCTPKHSSFKIVRQQIVCQQSMCRHVVIKQSLSTNFVNKMGAQKMWSNDASANYVEKFSYQIMSATSASTIIVSIHCVNKISVNRYMRTTSLP